jgi:hypothetical protein
MLATVVNFSVAGSHISAGNTDAVQSSGGEFDKPPLIKTLPSAIRVPFKSRRANAIGPTLRQLGEAAVKSITSAVLVGIAVESEVAPPAINTLPTSYITAVP